MELLKISRMENMEKIWLDELASNAFNKLKMLTVEHCGKLLSIFSSDAILARFRNLEKLIVTNCDLLEVVFQVQEYMSGAYSTSTFQLRELILEQLPKMKQVWSGHPHETLTFPCLRRIKVCKCESLKSLFPILVAKSMTQLEEIGVEHCGVEEIIPKEDVGVEASTSDLFFPRLTTLSLMTLPELRSFHKNSHISTWPLLKELEVGHCSKMRPFSFAGEIQSCQGSITSENQPALFSFEKVIPHLERLTLAGEDVEMMQHFIFDNLKQLSLACYHDKNVVFPSNFLLRRFPSLEHLVVICSSFEEIFPEDALGHGGATPSRELNAMETPIKALGNLKHLWLNHLYNLRQVWKDGSLMAEILKQIETLHVHRCPSLSTLLPSLTSFSCLGHLHVKDCAGMVHMGTCSAVKSLVYLTELILEDCAAMQDVVTDDGNGVEEISFLRLHVLRLERLPSFESFSPMNCTFRFPSLVHIMVRQCPKMNVFCKGALRTPKLEKKSLSKEDEQGRWEGDLNATIKTSLTCNKTFRIN